MCAARDGGSPTEPRAPLPRAKRGGCVWPAAKHIGCRRKRSAVCRRALNGAVPQVARSRSPCSVTKKQTAESDRLQNTIKF